MDDAENRVGPLHCLGLLGRAELSEPYFSLEVVVLVDVRDYFFCRLENGVVNYLVSEILPVNLLYPVQADSVGTFLQGP